MKIIFLTLLSVFLLSAIPTKFKASSSIKSDSIFEFNGLRFEKTLSTKSSDTEDLYAVLMPNTNETKQTALQMMTPLSDASLPVVLARIHPDMVESLSAYLHQSGLACGMLIKLDGQSLIDYTALNPTPIISVDQVNSDIQALVSQIDANLIKEYVLKLVEMGTRHHGSTSGRAVSAVLAGWYNEYAQGREDITINEYTHTGSQQKSLIVRIEGTKFPEEVIVLGSHLDSIAGFFGTGAAPGADDNASGTATNLEIFRNIIANNIYPERTIEIHAYAAEEIGLVGSAEIAKKYKSQNIKVIAMLQIDMNLYVKNGQPRIWLVSNDTHSGLNNHLAKMIDHYTGLPRSSARLTAGTSDHKSWTNQGFPAAFPFEDPNNYNQNIHTTKDLPNIEGISWEQAQGFAKLGFSYLAHFAGI